jgi:hypothetical protein
MRLPGSSKPFYRYCSSDSFKSCLSSLSISDKLFAFLHGDARPGSASLDCSTAVSSVQKYNTIAPTAPGAYGNPHCRPAPTCIQLSSSNTAWIHVCTHQSTFWTSVLCLLIGTGCWTGALLLTNEILCHSLRPPYYARHTAFT